MTGPVAGIRRRRTVAGLRETPHLPPDRDFYGQTLYNDKDGSVSCRSEVHVVEFTKDVPDSMFTLLRGPVEILDRCAVVIQKIGCGKIDAVGAMKEVRESSKGETDSEMKKTPTPK